MHILQQKIWQIAQREDLSGFGLRKIGNLIGESYPQKIKHHLMQLEKNGYVRLDDKKNRIVEVLKKSEQARKGVRLFDIPVVGSVNCGPAEIFAAQNVVGYVTVSQKILQGRNNADGVFAVQAVGDSLNRAKAIPGGVVDDGDLLIVDRNVKDPENGSYVISMIEGCANAKRFYKDNSSQVIKLVSESKLNIPEIVIHADDIRAFDYMINGKIIRVLKD